MHTIVPQYKGNVSAARSWKRRKSAVVGEEKDLGTKLHKTDILFSLCEFLVSSLIDFKQSTKSTVSSAVTFVHCCAICRRAATDNYFKLSVNLRIIFTIQSYIHSNVSK